ncbi:hypothetical protein N7456_010694 [Penicillium angulare]|uniref:Uncharacterized protein n=1 Tax=Penicillium angulare TaxID=116970 RepID=A0A9W9F738_9EURO|nr:hypothetical protein N7456_010694 [Penicillium angulare]
MAVLVVNRDPALPWEINSGDSSGIKASATWKYNGASHVEDSLLSAIYVIDMMESVFGSNPPNQKTQ